jgi:REP element-mobilizing transposase RayT
MWTKVGTGRRPVRCEYCNAWVCYRDMTEHAPRRKWLYHKTPSWVDSRGAVFFITICCRDRHHNQLALPEVSSAVFESVRVRHDRREWYPHLVLLMPDHLHMLVSIPVQHVELNRVITSWKRWLARQQGIQWQRGFIDHRLRNAESVREKADYILNNPVRAGLVDRPEDWPYVWPPPR